MCLYNFQQHNFSLRTIVVNGLVFWNFVCIYLSVCLFCDDPLLNLKPDIVLYNVNKFPLVSCRLEFIFFQNAIR